MATPQQYPTAQYAAYATPPVAGYNPQPYGAYPQQQQQQLPPGYTGAPVAGQQPHVIYVDQSGKPIGSNDPNAINRQPSWWVPERYRKPEEDGGAVCCSVMLLILGFFFPILWAINICFCSWHPTRTIRWCVIASGVLLVIYIILAIVLPLSFTGGGSSSYCGRYGC